MGKNKIAIIGSNSFSGAHFVDYCLEQDAEVIGLSRSAELDPAFLLYKLKSSHTKNFKFFCLDLNKDMDKVMQVLSEFKPSYIVNFAAQGMVAQSWQRPVDWFRTNTLSQVDFHSRLRHCDWLDRYVHISTPEVYGDCPTWITEHTNYKPSTPYAVSRAACDLSLMTYFQQYQFPVVFTRAANVFGPCQQLYRIIPRTICSLLTDQKIPLHGGGVSRRSFIHMRDVCEGTFKAMTSGTNGEIYHFSTSRMIRIYDLVKLITNMLGKDFSQWVNVEEERPGKDMAYMLSSAKAQSELEWKDKISLEQGLEEVLSWAKDHLSYLRTQPFDYIHKA